MRHALLSVTLALCAVPALAQINVTMNRVNEQGTGEPIGQVRIAASPHGLVFMPELQGLEPGLHGFHVHENASCAPGRDGKTTPAGAAGGHYDPKNSKQHGAPWGDGHLGDLPALYVDSQGRASHPVLAPRLKLSDLAGRALMVHAGGRRGQLLRPAPALGRRRGTGCVRHHPQGVSARFPKLYGNMHGVYPAHT